MHLEPTTFHIKKEKKSLLHWIHLKIVLDFSFDCAGTSETFFLLQSELLFYHTVTPPPKKYQHHAAMTFRSVKYSSCWVKDENMPVFILFIHQSMCRASAGKQRNAFF